MSATTNIEWCDSTFNPWIGCTRVSPACDDCYAARSTPARAMGVAWGPHEARRRTSDATWREPLRWQKHHHAFEQHHGRRRRVFCASLADVFDNAVPPAWRADLFALIAATPNLDWLLLTKRIGNAARMIDEASRAVYKGAGEPTWPWSNVWLGATVVNQSEADRDIPKLLWTPAAKRFLSIEPMLGAIDLERIQVHGGDAEVYPLRGTSDCVNDEGEPVDDVPALDWVICGGESGAKARPMNPNWARSLRDQCAAAGVPFLFKQWGCWAPGSSFADAIPSGEYCDFDGELKTDDERVWHVPKQAAGRLLDGVEHNGFPEVN